MPFFQRLVCCQTDENVYESDDSSSGEELGSGRIGAATAAVIRWPQHPSDHANFLSQGAGSIRVLPSSTRHATSRHRKSDSVAVLPSKPPSRGPWRGAADEEEDGADCRSLGETSKGWAASLVRVPRVHDVSCVIDPDLIFIFFF